MNVVFCFLFVLANYYLLYVLPNRVARKKLRIGIGLSLVAFIALSTGLSWLHANPFVVGATHQSFSANVLACVQVLIMLSFANQASSLINEKVASFHQQHNAENLPRQLVWLAVEKSATLQKVATGFWFFASLVIFHGIWFRA